MNKLRMIFFVIFLTFSLSVFGQENLSTEKIKQMTEQLVEISTDTNIQLTPAYSNQVVNLAKERNDAFAKALSDHPEQLVKFLIPDKITQMLPSTVQPYLEKTVNNIEGTLEILEMLPFKNSANTYQQELTQYVLRTDDKKVYYLHFSKGAPRNLKTGIRIRVRKAYLIPLTNNGLLILSNVDVLIISNTAKNALFGGLPDAFGPQKTLVFMMNFQDQPSNYPFTLEQVKYTIFTTVNNMFNEFSYGQTTVVGDVIDWTTLPINSTDSCGTITDTMRNSADTVAQAAGFDLAQYSRRIFIFPKTLSCNFAGSANRGGKPTNAWINGYNTSEVIGHEMGHNLGLGHSNSLECDETGCKTVPYGDLADTMGLPYSYPNSHFNAPQKEVLGWLAFQNSPPIQTITTSGTYTIDAYETRNTQLKALKILKETTADGSSDYYYIEFRQGIGFDTNIGNCSDCDFTKGVLVHQANSSYITGPVLLDKSPEDQDKSRKMVLLPGKSFNDPNVPNGGVTITLNSISAAGAIVNIVFGNQPPICKHAAATMSVSPDTTQWIIAGGRARYTVSLKNNDNEQCTPASFNFTIGRAIKNITSSLSSGSLLIEPGKTRIVNLDVSTHRKIQQGIYSIPVTAKNVTDQTMSATVTASLGVTKR